MNKQELTEATKAIGMMLEAFPSSQSRITEDTAKVYRFAIEDCSLEAVRRACRAFVRGEVPDHKADFAPSAPKLAQVAREFEMQVVVEEWEASRVFVTAGSKQWLQIQQLKNDTSLPTFVREGKEGWWFDRAVVQEAAKLALPKPMTPEEEAQMRDRIKALPAFKGVAFDVGVEQEAAEEAAVRGAA